MNRARYKHYRTTLIVVLLLFIAIFAMMFPGRDSWLGVAALIVAAACVVATLYQLLVTIMNGPDE